MYKYQICNIIDIYEDIDEYGDFMDDVEDIDDYDEYEDFLNKDEVDLYYGNEFVKEELEVKSERKILFHSERTPK